MRRDRARHGPATSGSRVWLALGSELVPGGPAAIDLSTCATWVSRRAAIYQRVLVERNMPPPGFDFSEAAREVIKTWIEGGS